MSIPKYKCHWFINSVKRTLALTIRRAVPIKVYRHLELSTHSLTLSGRSYQCK